MSTPADDDRFKVDPTKLPQPLELELSDRTLEQLTKLAAQTGRSVDELILEILDSHLPPY
jgi:hypothetical protein